MAYTEWLSAQTGQSYRLPTEAEWEYTARADTETVYWWGNDIGVNNANCSSSCGDSFSQTAPAGSFSANPFGLYDTTGNVWEWTCSEYASPYDGKEQICNNYASLLSLRGGSWLNDPEAVRAAHRGKYRPYDWDFRLGLRLARIF